MDYQLPATVENLVRVLGETDALALMKAYPKIRLKVPRKSSEALSDVISSEGVKKLISEYKGEVLYIPDAWNILRGYRDEKIRNDYGVKSTSELAREHNVSERWIEKIQEPCKKKIREDQGVLF